MFSIQRILLTFCLNFAMLLLGKSNATILNEPQFNEYQMAQNLSEAVLSILSQTLPHITNRLPLFNFFAHSDDVRHRRFFQDTIELTLNQLPSEFSVRIGVSQTMYTDRGRHDAVIFVDNVDALSFIYKDLSRLHLKAIYFYTIVLHTFSPYFYDEMLKILELCWRNGINLSNVLVHALWTSILLYTYFPYTKYHCASVAPVLRNRYENHQWQQHLEHYFPFRLGNLHRCRITCSTWEDMPYLKIKSNYLEGIEGRLLNFLEESLNFKIEFRLLTKEQIAKTVTDEYAVFNELFESGTDFVLGAFPFRSSELDSPYAPTIPYFLSDLYLFVNGKHKPFTSFEKLLFPFVIEVWFLLLFIFLLGALISMAATRQNHTTRSLLIGSQNSTPIYNMFIVGLGGSLTRPPRRNFARFLLFIWLLAALVVRGAYQALLFHYIRTDVDQKPPDTIQEILAQNYKIFMSASVYGATKELMELRAVASLNNESEIETFQQVSEGNDKIAVLAPYEYFAYYKSLFFKPPNIHVVKQKIFTQQLTIYMRKNSALERRFNKQIKTYIQSGLADRLIKQYMRNKFGKRKERESQQNIKKRMKCEEIFGILQLLLFGCVLSFLIFILEVLVFYFNRKFKGKGRRRRQRKRQAWNKNNP